MNKQKGSEKSIEQKHKAMQPIPDYTLEQYRDTDTPYEWLNEYAYDAFVLQRMIERMKAHAASVGMRSFMKMWTAYLKSQNGNVDDDNQLYTEFEGLPLPQQLKCGQYICNTDGVSTTDNFGFRRVICPHPIAPIRRFKNVDSREELLEIWFRRGNSENEIKDETIIFSKDDIANSILKLAKFGVVVNQRNAKDLAAYLMDMEEYNYGTIEEKKSVKRLGWIGDNDFSPYVEDVFFDGEEDFGSIFQSVQSFGKYDVWIDAIRKVRAEKTAARYYLAASFASVLLKPLGLLPFLVHTWGGTENGKSVALMVATSVWANPEIGEYIKTYDGTIYGQTTMAGFINNLPLCLDELQIQASQTEKDFDSTIYRLCEGVSKLQGKASGGLRKQMKWRNVILSNGEHTIIKPLSGGGARNRVFEIEAPDKIYSDLVGLCEIITRNYGFAGKQFVEWLMAQENMEKARTLQKKFYQELLDTGGTAKQTASASAMLAADAIATDLIFKDDMALTVQDMEAVMLKKDDIDINAKTLEWLRDFIAANSIHFSDEAKTEIWGKFDDDEDTVYFIRNIFDRELKSHGLDSKSFLSWADRMGYLDHETGRRDKQMRIPGTKGKPRCVCISFEKSHETDEMRNKLPF